MRIVKMSFIKKYKFHILGILILAGTSYFIFSQDNNSDELLVDGWVCPEEDIDINITLAYMRKLNDVNGVFKILDFLKSQGCDIALQKLQARMSADIESGISPGSSF